MRLRRKLEDRSGKTTVHPDRARRRVCVRCLPWKRSTEAAAVGGFDRLCRTSRRGDLARRGVDHSVRRNRRL
jgi:hypothetical protein